MSDTFTAIQQLVRSGDFRISAHGYEELAADGLAVRTVLAGIAMGEVIEEYPAFHKGPSVLVLHFGPKLQPVHSVWGIPRNCTRPAVLVTAYRPDPLRWSRDFRTRVR